MTFFNSSRKGQSALEFVIIIGFALLLISALIVVFQNRIRDMQEDRDVTRINQMYNLILSEIDFAQQARPFYNRSFYLPNEIGGQTYSLHINDKVDIVLTYNGVNNVRFLSDDARVIGQFNVPGRNIIYKDFAGRFIYVNTQPLPFIIIDGAPIYVDTSDLDSGDEFSWSPSSTLTSANDNFDGRANINSLKNVDFSLESFDAARACEESREKGYDDWYLPAIGQLRHIHDNLFAIESFSGFESFQLDSYWSSTENDMDLAFYFDFSSDVENQVAKATQKYVRCVRDNS